MFIASRYLRIVSVAVAQHPRRAALHCLAAQTHAKKNRITAGPRRLKRTMLASRIAPYGKKGVPRLRKPA